MARLIRKAAFLAGFGLAVAANAQPATQIEEVVVFGRNTDLVGTADSASVGHIGGADLLIRPLVKTAELLESLCGRAQHKSRSRQPDPDR